MKRGVLLLFVFFLILISNSNSIDCSSKGLTVCDTDYNCQEHSDTIQEITGYENYCSDVECPIIGNYCGDGICNGAETCGDTNIAPKCNTDCGLCPGLYPNGEQCSSNDDCANHNCIGPNFRCAPDTKECYFYVPSQAYDIGEPTNHQNICQVKCIPGGSCTEDNNYPGCLRDKPYCTILSNLECHYSSTADLGYGKWEVPCSTETPCNPATGECGSCTPDCPDSSTVDCGVSLGDGECEGHTCGTGTKCTTGTCIYEGGSWICSSGGPLQNGEPCSLSSECESGNCIGPNFHCALANKECYFYAPSQAFDVGEPDGYENVCWSKCSPGSCTEAVNYPKCGQDKPYCSMDSTNNLQCRIDGTSVKWLSANCPTGTSCDNGQCTTQGTSTSVEVNGKPLDKCAHHYPDTSTWECGQVAADLYCQREHQKQNALSFTSSDDAPSGTYKYYIEINSGYSCSGCISYFNSITCSSTTLESTCPQPTYPNDKWDRVWCEWNGALNEKLADTPDESNEKFHSYGSDATGKIQDDYIGFRSGRTINIPSTAEYTFTVGSDDGIKVWIDGQEITQLRNWGVHGYVTQTYTTTLSAGNHEFGIDYFENTGGAEVSFDYALVEIPESTYYQDSDGDTYGNPSISQTASTQPPGYVTNNQDCDDSNFNINPGISENTQTLCSDTIDNDCDNLIDCQDSGCIGIGDCCIGNNDCSDDEICATNTCTMPTKTGNPICCYTYSECLTAASANQDDSSKWPQPGDCALHAITERPECY